MGIYPINNNIYGISIFYYDLEKDEPNYKYNKKYNVKEILENKL